MPRQTGLLCRNGKWYVNIRLPRELRPAYGKQEFFRKSLGTSDYREAVHKLRFEAFKLDAEFALKRRELKASGEVSRGERASIRDLSEENAHRYVVRWFLSLEKQATEWWENEGINFKPEHLDAALDNLRTDELALGGWNTSYEADDGSHDLNMFLQAENIECPENSAAYRKLRPLFRLARLETTKRSIDRVLRRSVAVHEPLFSDVFAHTPQKPLRPIVTLGQMLERFTKALADAGRSEGTHRTYEVPVRLLREILGEDTPLESITSQQTERLFDSLRKAPTNATKRYRNMTLAQAVAEADRCGDANRLGAKTLENYFNNIVGIFNFAVEKRMLAINPAKDRWIRASFKSGEDDKPKALFTPDDLNKLFRAPLFTGCKDDGMGFATRGQNNPRRGRFWLPLLSLFHGLRCNEAAQLYTEDVGESEGIAFLFIREERANGSKCDKRLKTKQSKRRVPLHPELERLGFLNFVKERRNDAKHPRLFPELKRGEWVFQ